MHNRSSPWDEPGVLQALLELAALRQYSAGEISVKLSKRFNVDISRGSVIGKMFRENIPTRGKKNRPTLSAPKPIRCKGVARPAREVRERKPDPLEPQPLGDVDHGCRYLHGDALDRNFCGAPTTEYGTSWCEYHSMRVWNFAPRVKFISRRAA
jgi:hypothetical protein